MIVSLASPAILLSLYGGLLGLVYAGIEGLLYTSYLRTRLRLLTAHNALEENSCCQSPLQHIGFDFYTHPRTLYVANTAVSRVKTSMSFEHPNPLLRRGS